MTAGRFQIIFSAWHMLPFRNPMVLWQIVSHKYLRLLIPVAMIVAFMTNVVVLFGNSTGNGPAWLVLTAPYKWSLFLLQCVFYLAAGLGLRFKFGGLIGKAIYLPTFLVNSNMAALRGMYRYMTSSQTVVWKKAAR
jgi:hypothetical protein